MAITADELKKLLLQYDLAASQEIDEAIAQSEEEKLNLEKVLVLRGVISFQNLSQLIADYKGIPFIVLGKQAIDAKVLKLIPEVVATSRRVIAFKDAPDAVFLGMADTEDTEILRLLERKFKKNVEVYLASDTDIGETLILYKRGLEEEFDVLVQRHISEIEKALKATEEAIVEVPVVKIVDTILRYAYDNRASDIHFEPRETKVVIRFRVDGVLNDVLTISKLIYGLIVSRVKVMSKLRTDEHMAAQDGKFRIREQTYRMDVRVSIIPILEGEKIVMRLLTERAKKLTLEDLGFSEFCMDVLKRQIKRPHGMILATGPTGSGKTTTLYAILHILNKRSVNISTIEDPVEYEVDGINQIQVNPKTNLTFADGLRSILRQDPDIIMVGEVRDHETAGISINAALTGHLVLSTLHTNDAPTTLPRLIDMKVEPFLVASSVNLAIAQRLVRKICPKCIMSYEVMGKQLTDLKRVIDFKKILGQVPGKLLLYKGKGCSVCKHSGYIGRVAIFEVLELSDDIKELIMKQANAHELRKQAVGGGMITMMEDGILKVINGITTVDEVLRVAME
ncbi:MAG: type II/IV secretion system protein [Parcubacteria group bacterium]|nr:type II/IV secretion system protein [Parcubacteria group bacterium]